MRIFLGLIYCMILGFLGMIYIESGFLRGISALMLIVPPFLIALLFGNYFANRQLARHIRGRR